VVLRGVRPAFTFLLTTIAKSKCFVCIKGGRRVADLPSVPSSRRPSYRQLPFSLFHLLFVSFILIGPLFSPCSLHVTCFCFCRFVKIKVACMCWGLPSGSTPSGQTKERDQEYLILFISLVCYSRGTCFANNWSPHQLIGGLSWKDLLYSSIVSPSK
jgi:hypothetical protein